MEVRGNAMKAHAVKDSYWRVNLGSDEIVPDE